MNINNPSQASSVAGEETNSFEAALRKVAEQFAREDPESSDSNFDTIVELYLRPMLAAVASVQSQPSSAAAKTIAREASAEIREWFWESFGVRLGPPLSVKKLDNLIESAITRALSAQQEGGEAEKNKARMDWLERNGPSIHLSCWKGEGAGTNPWTIHTEFPDKQIAEGDTVREAIDDAMLSAGEKL